MSQGERRLAAIMFTDIVGYTALAQTNETLAMKLLEKHRELIRPIFPKHSGREVKTIGDAFLVEFGSALEATECAAEMQKMLHEYNEGEKETVMVRIGIHVGDVIHRDGDVYGDAVNIASRIEPLASGGGICISGQVYDQVRNKTPYKLVMLQPKELKNVAFQINVCKLELPWESSMKSGAEYDRRRLAVLPFTNISADPNDEYFADGMTEELISTTSSIKDLTIIARTSVMRYKGSTKGIEEIGKELGVGTVMEGSVRKAGNRLRITVQLIDVQNQGHLWAQSYDRDFDDVFAVQSDIAKQVADALRVSILPNETKKIEKRPTQSTEAFTLFLRGRYLWNQRTKEAVSKAVGYFEKTIEIDPSYAMAFVGLADCYVILGDQGALPSNKAFPRARELATKALELDDSNAEAHATLGTILEHEWDWAGSERELKRAIELNPNYPTAHQWYAIHLRIVGRPSEAMAEIQRAHELDPLSPIITLNVAITYNFERRYDEALDSLKQLLETDPDFAFAHYHLGLVYAAKTMFAEAIAEVQKARALTAAAYPSDVLTYSLAMSGRREDAVKVVDELIERSRTEYVSAFSIGSAYLAIDKDKAFEWLEKALEARDGQLLYMNQLLSLLFEGIQSDPRYVALRRRMGLER